MCEVAMHCKGLPPLILPLATTDEANESFKRLQPLQKKARMKLCTEMLLSYEAVYGKWSLGGR